MKPHQINPVDLAVRAIGGQDIDLATKVGVSPAAVCRWRKNGEIPAKRLAAVCSLTGLPPHVLCPAFSAPDVKAERVER